MPLFSGELVIKKYPEQVLEAPSAIVDTIEEYMVGGKELFTHYHNSTAPPDRYLNPEDLKWVNVKEWPRYA